MATITIDPVNRIEGHLKVTVTKLWKREALSQTPNAQATSSGALS